MAQSWTSDELIENVKRITHLPTSTGTYDTDDFLALLDFVMQGTILPIIVGVRQNHFLRYTDFELNDDSQYRIPTRAIASGLQAMQNVISNYLQPIDLVYVTELTSTIGSPTTNYCGYITRNVVNVKPSPGNGQIRMWFNDRPGKLIATASAAAVGSIDSTTQITATSVPATFTTGRTYDLVQGKPPFDTLAYDITVSNIASTTITFDEALPSSLQDGDYLCLAGEAPVAQIPAEVWPLLVQGTAVKINEAQGYSQKLSESKDAFKQMREDALTILTPRVEQQAPIIRNNVLRPGIRPLLWRPWF